MALSEELKKIYTNHQDTRMYYDTIQLNHPNFQQKNADMLPSETSYPNDTSYPADYNLAENGYYMIRADESKTFNVEGVPTLFQVFPFNVVVPQQGSDQQDMAVVFDNVSTELISGLEAAAMNTAVPITMTYRTYIDGDAEPQITPIVLSLTNFTVDIKTVSATATRSDLYNRRFPYGKTSTFDKKYVGLYL